MPAESDSDRLFSPASPFWQVNREMLLGLAGMRALLMELAHPLIAAGVAEHSDFRERPFKRLYRTMRLMSCITFGSRKAARLAVQRIRSVPQFCAGGIAATSRLPPFRPCLQCERSATKALGSGDADRFESMPLRTVCAAALGGGEGVLLSRQSTDGPAAGDRFSQDAGGLRQLCRLSSNDAVRGDSCGQRSGARSGRGPARGAIARKDRARRQLRQHWTASEGSSCGLRSLME